MLLAHAVFGTAFVVAVVRARLTGMDLSAEEASRDLGACAASTFLRITIPSIAPAIVAGALLVFTLSLDEFVIAFFTAGADHARPCRSPSTRWCASASRPRSTRWRPSSSS